MLHPCPAGFHSCSSGKNRHRVSVPPSDLAVDISSAGSRSPSSVWPPLPSSPRQAASLKRVRFAPCDRPPVNLTHVVFFAILFAFFYCMREWILIMSPNAVSLDSSTRRNILLQRVAMKDLSTRFWMCFRPLSAAGVSLFLLWIASCGWNAARLRKRRSAA